MGAALADPELRDRREQAGDLPFLLVGRLVERPRDAQRQCRGGFRLERQVGSTLRIDGCSINFLPKASRWAV